MSYQNHTHTNQNVKAEGSKNVATIQPTALTAFHILSGFLSVFLNLITHINFLNLIHPPRGFIDF